MARHPEGTLFGDFTVVIMYIIYIVNSGNEPAKGTAYL